MEQPNTSEQGAPAVAEPTDDARPSGQPDAGASGDEQAPSQPFDMDGWIRGSAGHPTSKPDEAGPSGESAPEGEASKPGGPERGPDGKFVGRRATGIESKQKLDALEAKYGTTDPDAIAERVLAERQAESARQADDAKLTELAKTREADVARFRALQEIPDAKLSSADYAWREDFKEKLDLLPEVGEYHRLIADQRVAQAEAALTTTLRSELAEIAALPGVDADEFRRLPTFGRLAHHAYESGGRARQPEFDALAAENRRLVDENRQLRYAGPNGLGAVRDPGVGASAPGTVAVDGDTWIRNLIGRG